jgi:hypothetical protein
LLFTIRTLPAGLTFVSLSSACRWGNTPLDDAWIGGNKNLIKLLEVTRTSQLSELSDCSQEIRGTNKIVVLTYCITILNYLVSNKLSISGWNFIAHKFVAEKNSWYFIKFDFFFFGLQTI